MTFTLDLTAQPYTDITRFRLSVGDTNAEAPIFSDEEITGLIAEYGTWQDAVIAGLRWIITQLSSTPTFTADWLQVDVSKALMAYRQLLQEFEVREGIGSVGGGAVYPVRRDSNANLG